MSNEIRDYVRASKRIQYLAAIVAGAAIGVLLISSTLHAAVAVTVGCVVLLVFGYRDEQGRYLASITCVLHDYERRLIASSAEFELGLRRASDDLCAVIHDINHAVDLVPMTTAVEATIAGLEAGANSPSEANGVEDLSVAIDAVGRDLLSQGELQLDSFESGVQALSSVIRRLDLEQSEVVSETLFELDLIEPPESLSADHAQLIGAFSDLNRAMTIPATDDSREYNAVNAQRRSKLRDAALSVQSSVEHLNRSLA